MAKTRGFVARLFAKIGGAIFGFLSRCEDNGVVPKMSRWLKLSLLGFFVALVGAMALEANEDVVTCYKPMQLPRVSITDASIVPNPTKGADSVKVTATARIPPYDIGTSYIMGASLSLGNDTLRYPMRAVDGRFGDTLEIIEASLYVGGLEPETTWVNLEVNTSQRRFQTESVALVISEPQPDSTDEKEE